MGSPASLRMRNDLSELSRLAEWVQVWAEQHGVAEQTAQFVDLCSTEAVTNIMTHAIADARASEVRVLLERQGSDVVLQIEDDGVAFDPTAAEPVPLATMESTRLGGWGIRIVRRFSDEIRYRRVDGRNCLTLVFRQQPPVAA